MKNTLVVLVLLSVFVSSCSTKFKVGADYKEVTVVYGLLSMSDTAHYIKITKGFFDEKLNNLELAQNPDSIYFSDLEVKVESLINGNVAETLPLTKVDLVLEGYPKAPGTFATIPNYAYKFKKTLDPTRTYRLKIKNNLTGKEVQGETSIITSSSSVFKFIKPSDPLEPINFADNQNPFAFIWRGPSTAAFYDVVVRFRYQELDQTTNDTTYIEKDITVAKNIPTTGGELSASVSSVDFFKQLNSALGDAPLSIKRYVDTPGLMILGGGQALKTYIEVNAAQGGITYDQIKPNYTNLSGGDVFGLFSTRGQIIMNEINFTGATVDSIRNGVYTQNLRIVGISDK